ncbi:MAG: hypothetical protein KDA86_24385 [Planctomycetaceae bacterium]|nr:hypothetical protein [Planctomycetaceae bacterium]
MLESQDYELTGVQGWLSRQGPVVFSAWTIAAAFSTYFCMYAFRKPFTAGTYEGLRAFEGSYWWEMDLKTVLVVSQVFGYTVSKFIGIKFVSEVHARWRAPAIVGLIGLAELALVLFALVPIPLKAAMLFLNGLPLGIVFGLVLAFLEGRQVTEALTAGLCASFIFASGVVKSVGRSLVVDYSISEYWMPAATGLMFVVPLLISVWLLRQIPPPSKEDVALRMERVPLNREQRWSFYWRYGVGLTLLILIFITLTIIRSVRDDFAVEIWRDMGESAQPSVYARSELIVMLLVTALNGTAIWIKRNRTAFLSSLLLIAVGFGITLAAVMMQSSGQITPFAFMVLSGIGLYIPYVAFHTTVFERLIASTGEPGNLGFLMYVADSTGYLGYVGVLLYKSFAHEAGNMLNFFLILSVAISMFSIIAVAMSSWYFNRRLADDASVLTMESA